MMTLLLLCPVCRSDAADTLGVTGKLSDPLDATVVMRCEDCATAYLSPAPSPPAGPTRQPADAAVIRRLLGHWTNGVRAESRILVIDDAATVPESGRYDFILLPGSLESADDPSALLGHARSLLVERGEIIVILGNAASSCFTVFGGRHWDGYQNAGVRQQLTPTAMQRLSASAGLRIARLETRFVSGGWLRSTRNWLQDWGAGRALIGLLTGPWILPQFVAMLLEAQAVARGRGASLGAVLVLP
jgi:hypothetical protein